MGARKDAITAMHVHASAPGGGVHAELRGYDGIDVYFSTGFYEQADERDLERRLTALARLVWVQRQRAYREAMAPFAIHPGDHPVEDEHDEAFYDERSRLVAAGRSDDGRVGIRVTGMTDWEVQVADGARRALGERAFLDALHQAVVRLLADQSRQIMELKGRVYG